MLIRHHHDNRVFLILCPPGSRLRRSEAAAESVVYVPWEGREVPVFEEPPVLLVQLAQAGRYGLRLVGVEEVPES